MMMIRLVVSPENIGYAKESVLREEMGDEVVRFHKYVRCAKDLVITLEES